MRLYATLSSTDHSFTVERHRATDTAEPKVTINSANIYISLDLEAARHLLDELDAAVTALEAEEAGDLLQVEAEERESRERPAT